MNTTTSCRKGEYRARSAERLLDLVQVVAHHFKARNDKIDRAPVNNLNLTTTRKWSF